MRTSVVRSAVLGGIFSALVLAAPATAAALTSYQGSDYSQDFNSRHNMRTCDQESDQTPVKAVYQKTDGRWDDVKDSDGNNGRCAEEGTGGTVLKHKTCEYRWGWPDACGNWQGY